MFNPTGHNIRYIRLCRLRVATQIQMVSFEVIVITSVEADYYNIGILFTVLVRHLTYIANTCIIYFVIIQY